MSQQTPVPGRRQALECLAFGASTHIHPIVQKVKSNLTPRRARSAAYPQPPAVASAGPGRLKVPREELPSVTSVSVVRQLRSLSVNDRAIA